MGLGDLLFEESGELNLNISVQIVVLVHLIDVPLSDGSSQVLVITGHDHLHQVLILEHIVRI